MQYTMMILKASAASVRVFKLCASAITNLWSQCVQKLWKLHLYSIYSQFEEKFWNSNLRASFLRHLKCFSIFLLLNVLFLISLGKRLLGFKKVVFTFVPIGSNRNFKHTCFHFLSFVFQEIFIVSFTLFLASPFIAYTPICFPSANEVRKTSLQIWHMPEDPLLRLINSIIFAFLFQSSYSNASTHFWLHVQPCGILQTNGNQIQTSCILNDHLIT